MRHGESTWNLENRWILTHRMVAMNTFDDILEVIHHINFNKRDNRPDNLLPMLWNDHTKLHKEKMIGLLNYAKSEYGRVS